MAGTRFHVLCPADQVLHACSQLFQDSDCTGRLRDLVDIDSLIGELGRTEQFWERLVARSRIHGLDRSLFYSLRYATRYLGTDVPREVMADIPAAPALVAAFMDQVVPLALLPTHPDHAPPISVRFSRWLLFLRSHWLRMPPLLLLRHALTKGWRTVQPRSKQEEAKTA